MKIGLFGINMGPCASPRTAAAVARAAEAAGFESLWTGEHIIVPDPQVPRAPVAADSSKLGPTRGRWAADRPSPVAPDFPMLDSTVALAFVAAHTSTIRLGTGIIILPQRNPVVLAKELASADVLSGGRLIFGIGIGYVKPEFDAMGIPFDHKGARAEEYLRAMIALWSMEKPEFQGRWVNFKGMNAAPRPVQKPHPEIVFGGHSPEGFARAVRLAKGWYGFRRDLDDTKRSIEGLKAACAREGRRFEDLEISITPSGPVDRDVARRFADAGVHRLILLFRADEDEAGVLKLVSWAERELVGKV